MKKVILFITVSITILIIWTFPIDSGAKISVQSLPHSQLITEQKSQPQIDVVFVLDTTGSMGGLIQAAKEKIWSIASTMASANQAPDIRMGLIAYRDRGDQYITKRVALTQDLDIMYQRLMQFQAQGGGDGPESVNQALHEAVTKMNWRQQKQTYKVIFLIGDAPPHMNYQNDVPYTETIKLAHQQGIVINTIQCGNLSATTLPWQQIAQLSQGEYFKVNQSGSAVAIHTPFDKKIASISSKLDDSVIAYGDKSTREKIIHKNAVAKKLASKLPTDAKARRVRFNQTKSGKANSVVNNDLIEKLRVGELKIKDVKKQDLPKSLASLPHAERDELLQQKVTQRQHLKQELNRALQERKHYLNEEVAKLGGLKESLDSKIYGAIKKQAKKKGMKYDKEHPEY